MPVARHDDIVETVIAIERDGDAYEEVVDAGGAGGATTSEPTLASCTASSRHPRPVSVGAPSCPPLGP